MKWIRWAIDIIKQLWEKWTDFLDMYTIEEKIQGFMHYSVLYYGCIYCVSFVSLRLQCGEKGQSCGGRRMAGGQAAPRRPDSEPARQCYHTRLEAHVLDRAGRFRRD